MATTLEELRVIIEGEIAPFQKKIKEMEGKLKQTQSKVQASTSKMKDTVSKHTSGIGAAFGKLAKFAALAYVGKKMLDLGKYSTQMALEVTASINQIRRQMGESSQAFLKWIDNNANAMNMSVAEATNYGAVYSNLFSNFIKDSNKLSAYTGKMLQTSAVIAQGTGRTMTDVMERIRSGLLGNTEAIEDLGINVNIAMIESTEAFKRFANGQSWKDLDYNTQQQIRLMAILEQATAKYGNTLQQSVNGRISLFKSLLSDAALNIGNALLPILNAIMPVLNSLAMALKNVTAKLAEFIALMFNKKATVKNGGAMGAVADSAKNAQDAVGGLGDAMSDVDDASDGTAGNLDDTAKAAKKAAKELLGLAGFDEITTLNLNKDDDSDGTGGNGGKGKGKGGGSPADILPEIALEDMDNQFKSIFDGWGAKLKPLFDLFSKGFNSAFRSDGLERIKKALDRIKKTLSEIVTDERVVTSFGKMTEKIAYALGQVTGSIGTVVIGIGVFIAESIANGLERQKERIVRALATLFDNSGDIAQAIGNIAESISGTFYDVITSSGAVRIGSAFVSALLSAGSSMMEVGSSLARDVFKGFERIVTENMPALGDAIRASLENIAPVFETLEQFVDRLGVTLTKIYDEHVSPFIDSFSSGISDIVRTLVDGYDTYINPVLENFGKLFSEVYDEKIAPALDNIGKAIGSLIDILTVFWEQSLKPHFESLANILMPLLAIIGEVFFTNLIETIGTIAEIIGDVALALSGLLDFLTGVFTGDWEQAWEGIKNLFAGIIKAILRALGIDVDELIGEFQRWWDDIVRIFKDLGKWFGERWNDIKNALSAADTWIGEKFSEAFEAVKRAFKDIGSFFSGVWDTVKGIFVNAGQAVGDAVGGAFRGAVNAVLGTIENVVNGFIDMINGVIGIINALPGVSLGYIGGVSLPRLARGGIVDSPTVAMIGEAGKEVVMPLENTGFLQTMGRVVGGAVVNALGGGLSQSPNWPSGDIIIQIGSREFGRFTIDEINKAQEQAGQLLLNI
ncbi:hypothetical protein [Streptococcus acidominimus]|uniref:TMP repeat-containing protein n=1 Tax=Streptococcus acidominimus TaxID=1326 RepID=A0A1Q8EFS7_STRAI|nr:hypothetical protein [Streptococcus acidominimus]OLF50660.1 hypothetical protein BU200_01175 [Streptococcus acidominimus]QBX13682.1 tail length tape-measure protein [Streptococcus phage Javan1]SUN05044.1 TMP repeat-containing protein [Streptococcus acidominimus]